MKTKNSPWKCRQHRKKRDLQQNSCLLVLVLVLQIWFSFITIVECKIKNKKNIHRIGSSNAKQILSPAAAAALVRERNQNIQQREIKPLVNQKKPAKKTQQQQLQEKLVKTATATAIAAVAGQKQQKQKLQPQEGEEDDGEEETYYELPFDTTVFSVGACKKVEYAVHYITSLDFNTKSFALTMNVTTVPEEERSDVFRDVYLFLCIITPLSLGMTFLGSHLLLPTCILSAVALGIFAVFHLVDNYVWGGLDCQMKLIASAIMASLAAMAATSFVRFGLFSLGALATGGGSYLLFDAFPILDRGAEYMGIDVTSESDLTTSGWIITILLGLFGGLLIRWYEQASLEIVTAVFGGIGCSYSLHTFFVLKGGEMHRSIVFLIAWFISFAGWRFQRRRRLWREIRYSPKRDEDAYYNSSSSSSSALALQQQHFLPHSTVTWEPMHVVDAFAASNPSQLPQPSWQQLQILLQRQRQPRQYAPIVQQPNGPSSEQIAELTKSINSFLETVTKEKETDEKES